MRRELGIIQSDLHANAVRLAGRDPDRLLQAAEYAASIGLEVLIGPELWNATPQQTLQFVTRFAAAAEPLRRLFPEQLTLCVGNELTLFMRGIVAGRNFAQRTRGPGLREFVLSDQRALRRFLGELAASVRRVFGGPISYCALPVEHVGWEHFDAIGVNYYRQSYQPLTDDQYLAKIKHLQAAGKPVVITEFGFASCQDADAPELLGTFNTTPLSFLAAHLPVIRRHYPPRAKVIHPRDERGQAQLLVDQLHLLDRAEVDGAFVMCFSFPLAPYSENPHGDIDATSLSIVRTLPPGKHGTSYPDMRWEPKQAFKAIADYYAAH
ncbi:MAG: abortive infection protein [Solirubrobacteraceae bacterium]